ncbi:MAG: hypothetical protein ACI920_001978, partial [Saprospiraceae bacterium]
MHIVHFKKKSMAKDQGKKSMLSDYLPNEKDNLE